MCNRACRVSFLNELFDVVELMMFVGIRVIWESVRVF